MEPTFANEETSLMKRALGLTAALLLAAIPILSAAQTNAPAMHDAMGRMDNMAMPKSAMKQNVMALGSLPSSLQGKPVVVRIHADWCPACKSTHATYEGVQKKFSGKATFVTFDVTDAKTAAASATNAAKLGLTKLFDADKTATSTVAVINPKTGAVSASLYNDNRPADYAKAIDAVQAQLQHS